MRAQNGDRHRQVDQVGLYLLSVSDKWPFNIMDVYCFSDQFAVKKPTFCNPQKICLTYYVNHKVGLSLDAR